jgi:hypothetical protein
MAREGSLYKYVTEGELDSKIRKILLGWAAASPDGHIALHLTG